MGTPQQKILVTAALPYANGYIHLGHLAGAYLPADIYVRYQRMKGRDILFISGSDEHGVAITVSAEAEKTTPKAIIDRYHPANLKSFQDFGMSFDVYSRTSLPLHHATAKEFFSEFHRRGILREKREKQLYCEKDSMFLADRYVEGTCPNCKFTQARGDQCENCGTWLNQVELIDPRCKICGTTPVIRETSHWYYPLGSYQARLEQYITERNARDHWKENVLRYCESWFKAGLEDRAVTRDLSWGVQVPVPGYESKVIYVWFDAVLGYISAAKEWSTLKGTPDAWKQYWQDPSTKYVAFIGKDNVVFHCIVFPAMLMAWNDGGKEQYVLPENVPANEFLNFEGQKFSKSRGWGVDLKDFLTFFPADYLRYSLAVNLPESRDSDFSLKDFQARVNNELADTFGNFVNRTIAFAGKNFGNKVPSAGALSPQDTEMLAAMKATPAVVGALFDSYKFREGVAEAMNLGRTANKYFNDSQPWKSIKSDPVQCATTLNVCLQITRSLAILFAPVIPIIAERVWKQLGCEGSVHQALWDEAGDPSLAAGHVFAAPEIVVPKIDDEAIKKIETFLAGEPEKLKDQKPMITIDDFKKLDLRIATILSVEPIPKSEKLLKIQVEIGTERRQVLAGIAKHYTPEELVGKQIVVVANLQPAKLMGQESQGMLLAANADDGSLAIISPAKAIASASIVR